MGPRSDLGFTLVELLVVVAVLALLAVFAVPKTYAAINSSRQTKVAHDLVQIQGALERHYADLGYYPVKLNDLITHGYLKRGFRFKSPENRWFFYAVDDNHDNTPLHYVLGAPGGDAGSPYKLFHRQPLPAGLDANQRALAWVRYDASHSSSMLYLYAEDDVSSWSGPKPDSLEFYRIGCRESTPEPCDVAAN